MPPERTPTSVLPLKNDVLLVLLALAVEPMHGYALIQKIEDDSHGKVVPQAGAFYRQIRNMLGDGIIEECDDADSARDGKRRRTYRITPRGRSVARAEIDRLAGLVRAGRRTLAGRVR